MTVDPSIATIVGFGFALLIALVGYLGRRQIERLENDLDDERKAREKDRHDQRDAINGVGARLADLREKVLSECINHDRLTQAMEPVMTRLGEIRSDIKEIYGRLDGKQDKPRGGD